MTRDELNPKWRAKYDALIAELGKELDKIPEPERKEGVVILSNGKTMKPYRELEKKYLPQLRKIMLDAEEDMKASEKENM